MNPDAILSSLRSMEPPPRAKFTRGTGPNALPYGAATQLNSQPTPNPGAEASQAQPSPAPASAPPQAPPQPHVPRGDIEQYLFQPPLPGETMVKPPPPAGLDQWLGPLALMAADPNATPAVKMAFASVMKRARESGLL